LIVVDASAAIEVLLATAAGERCAARLFAAGESLHAPHLIDVEVAQVLRRYAAAGDLPEERGRGALTDLLAMPLERYPHEPLLHRVWELRRNLTAYDAVYVALAEALEATLLTRDARLARSRGHQARIELG
jgi:predicted nucleic acid-binding protein